jgi:hypothetical protein
MTSFSQAMLRQEQQLRRQRYRRKIRRVALVFGVSALFVFLLFVLP